MLKTFFFHLATIQVCFLIGMVLVIVQKYLVSGIGHAKRKVHVLFIAISYVILLLLTLRGVYIGVFFPDYPLFEISLYALCIAYLSGDIAMLKMLDWIAHTSREEDHGAIAKT